MPTDSITDPFVWAQTDALVNAGYDEILAKRAVANASWILWALSGRQLHGQGTRIDVYRLTPYCAAGRRDFLLAYRPVRSVTSVTSIRAWTNETATWTEGTHWIAYGSRLVLAFGLAPHDRLTVTYVVKSNLPPGTYEVVLKLAEQYLLAASGKSCALPERITSVTRSGVSWTILDPADFLDKGLLGVVQIDSWLSAVNPRRNKQRAQVFDSRAPRLISSKWEAVPFDSDTIDSVLTYYGHGAAEDLDSTWLASTPVSGDAYVDVDSDELYTFPL